MNGSSKPVRGARFALGCGLLGATLAFLHTSAVAETVTHASLAANSSAIVSLKDPRNGTVFYVESNGHTLAALASDGRVVWIAPLNRSRSEAYARHSPPEPGRRHALGHCGKSDSYAVEIDSGKNSYLGSD